MSNILEVIAVVEGQTEQTFIREVLGPFLAQGQIFVRASLVGKPGHKGGNVKYARLKNDVLKFLQQRPDTLVTTMVDYYRLPRDWPGRNLIQPAMDAGTKAETIENAVLNDIAATLERHNVRQRFIPYIEMHEFEAMLFSDPVVLSDNLGVDPSVIERIVRECGEPEEIDEGDETARSKRIVALRPGYRKIVMGNSIAKAIGIPKIRQQCPHFNAWLTRIDSFRL